jgi:uncharacterized membrane protein
MKVFVWVVVFIVLVCLLWSGESKAKTDTNKLQIGVKKRAENCEKKSKKGDKLQMHYTVRGTPPCHQRL